MKMTTRLVQLHHPSQERKVALVDEPYLQILSGSRSVYDLAMEAIAKEQSLISVIRDRISETTVPYDEVYEGRSEWKLLPAFDHPDNPMLCMVAGTGLTHRNSALNRQMMHVSGENKPTDSMQMYQWGVEGGTPPAGQIGVQPEWFYKGNGSTLRAHAQPLTVPAFGNDGGEEPEIAGIYVIDECGAPYRIGFCSGNEFSDHIMEKKNYLYLAPSKLRECSIGPELVLDASFHVFEGEVSVTRNGENLWSSSIRSGEENMSHNLANLEYHHFKYPGHRIPLQAHVHFFGADAFSFGNQVKLQDGDIMSVSWQGMGRPLRNPISVKHEAEAPVQIRSLA